MIIQPGATDKKKVLTCAFVFPFIIFICLALLIVLLGPADSYSPELSFNLPAFQTLNAGDISSIMLCDHLIEDPANIYAIVNTLHSSKLSEVQSSFDSSGHALSATPLPFIINFKDARKLRFMISRYLKEPPGAVLNVQNLDYTSYFVKDLPIVLEQAGVSLPEKVNGYWVGMDVFKHETLGRAKVHLQNESKAKPLTLYNIANSSSLDHPSAIIVRIFICSLCSGIAIYLILVLLYFALFHKENLFSNSLAKAQKTDQNILLGKIFPILFFALFAWLFGSQAFSLQSNWSRYAGLKEALLKNKCQILTGVLTDVKFHKDGHNPLDLAMIEVQGHQFYFPSNQNTDKVFFNTNKWVDWTPEKLKPNTQVAIWYTTIPGWNSPSEHVARLDVFD